MKGIVLCNKGTEEIVSLDIQEILKKKSVLKDGMVTFEFDKKEELCKLAYLSQSIRKVILIIDSFRFISEENIIERVEKLKLDEWLKKGSTFKVVSDIENSQIDHEEIKGKVGEAIINNITDYKQEVDLNNPDITICLCINKNMAFLGVDFTGLDMSKRSYRIFSSSKNIKSTIAYSMVRLSGYEKGELLIDPFCLSGSIAIEAALYSTDFPVRYFDKNNFLFNKIIEFDFEKIDKKIKKERHKIYAIDCLFKNINAAKKNAKIAGINKMINFSRTEIDWLDTKFNEETVDRIITAVPNISKYSNKSEILKLYKELFHQAEFILKKKGTIVICTTNPEEIKEKAKEKFRLEEEKEVWQGKEKLILLKFLKK